MNKIGNKLTVILAAVFMLSSIGLASPALAEGGEKSLKDIKGHWAEQLIVKWVGKGTINGYSDGTFRPNKAITGAELTAIANRLLAAQGKTVADLTDVPGNIAAKPNKSVTREDAIVLFYKMLELEAQEGAWTTFKDAAAIHSYAVNAVNTMYEKELISGYKDGTFRPQGAISRAEIVKIIDLASILGYLANISDGIAANEDITLIKETRPFGEAVTAMAIKYSKPVDGSKLKATVYAVEATLGEVTAARTVTKVYTNDSAATAPASKTGEYVIIELDAAKDMNAGTMLYDFAIGKNRLYKLNYYVTQLADITAADGTKIASGSKQKSGSEANAIVDSFKALTYTSKAGNKLDYRLYEPETAPGEKYPLVIFLHGNGERGANGVAQLLGNTGATVWASAENQAKNPSFVLAPQNPLIQSGLWLEKNVYETTLELIKSVASNPLIDPDRIYITGVSMGGFGTWGFIQRNPDLFAAAMPVCGGGDLTKVEAIKDMPIWAFHAADDPVVKVAGEIDLYMPEFMINGTRDMVAALKAIGSTKVKYTEYEPGYVAMPVAPMAHFSWVPAYNTQEAIDWMFEQSK
ncbi:S-layer homology domain-containing protein [Paenibacillus alkaliterrae]|uniref:S-layer homology domain-containing protein n=1 Tax=Paenibacillus alkaliterrae TaxID=320909 RepID=UPI001F2B5C63|nr:S-layer homology domain-containing protein [Paenibacillus alkaliterrae]MCF2941754.1 S-layer homology domain-containing protein [Paenibacillus alkaliterrae]